jgi:hypothetical protein
MEGECQAECVWSGLSSPLLLIFDLELLMTDGDN